MEIAERGDSKRTCAANASTNATATAPVVVPTPQAAASSMALAAAAAAAALGQTRTSAFYHKAEQHKASGFSIDELMKR